MVNQQKKEVLKHFDAWAVYYENEIWNRDKYFHRFLYKQVLNIVLILTDQTILELGVGPGIYLERFVQKEHHVIGVDISLNMLKITRKKLRKKYYEQFHLILADAEYLPFRKNIFNIVNCIEVLRHLPNPYKTIWHVFNEVKRIMKNGGSFLISIPNILFPLNQFSVFYYIIPRILLLLFNKKIGYHYNKTGSFPHFPVLYNEPEDHMYNLWFVKKIIRKLHLETTTLQGIFFFPACPRIFFPIVQKLNSLMRSSFWLILAYSFFLKISK
ncbi:MAG: class I SAM-dependent methyltransferase [Candidatus Helarchaeota archaeon]